jgi:filamin
MHVTIDDYHVGGSPFELKINMNCDPSKVKFNLDDVKTGILNQEIKTLIDTSNAGPGELTAHCHGALKPAVCKFEDKQNGIFLLRINPQEIGRHLLEIKYNNEHILDGPFQIRIFAPPDATKVILFLK